MARFLLPVRPSRSRTSFIDGRRGPVIETLVQALIVVKPEVALDAGARFGDRFVVLQVVEPFLYYSCMYLNPENVL
jgi:hypothetical protein